ncbi:MAG: histidine kinase [Gorillibacterium sp.]|nr:histidine kinase [Gorillibacterium sp.]
MSGKIQNFSQFILKRFSGMHARLVIYALVLMLVTLPIMGMITYSILSKTTNTLHRSLNEEQTAALAGDVETTFDSTRNTADLIALNENVRYVLSTPLGGLSGLEKINLLTSLNQTVSGIWAPSQDRMISQLYVFGINGLSTNWLIREEITIPDSKISMELNKSGKNYIFFTPTQFPDDAFAKFLNVTWGNILYLASSIKNTDNETIGYILIQVNDDFIREHLESTDDGFSNILSQGKTIWSSKVKLQEPDKGLLRLTHPLNYQDWSIERFVADTSYSDGLRSMLVTTLWVTGLCLIFTSLISIYLSYMITRSGKRLSRLFSWSEHPDSIHRFPNFVLKKSKFRFLTFRHKVLIYFLLIIIIPSVALTYLTISSNNRILCSMKNDQWSNALDQSLKRMDITLRGESGVLDGLFASLSLQQMLLAVNLSESDRNDKIRQVIYATNFIKFNVSYVNIYNKDGNLLHSSLGRYDDRYLDEGNQIDITQLRDIEDGAIHWVPGYTDIYNNRVYAAVREMKSITNGNFENIGYAVVVFNTNRLELFFRNLLTISLSTVFIGDAEGSLFYDPKSSVTDSARYSFAETMSNQNNLQLTSNETGWKVVALPPIANNNKENGKIIALYLIYLGLCLLLYSVITYRVSAKFSRPVEMLLGEIKRIEHQNLNMEVPVPTDHSRSDEYVELANSFNAMTIRIKSLIEEVYEYQISQNELMLKWKIAELRALQMQINPHFLYNTLDSIRFKAMFMSGGTNEVSEMICCLSEMLRYSVKQESQFVTVKEELSHIENYMIIQQMRFGDKLRIEWHIDESLLNQKVMKLLLQPLVENSITHGLEQKKGMGMIRICLIREDQGMKIHIIDDGVGIPEERIKEIEFRIKEFNGQTTEFKHDTIASIGILNVHGRIRLQYGAPYGLTVYSNPTKGTEFVLFLPLSGEKEQQDV